MEVDKVHNKRYELTLEFLKSNELLKEGSSILDCGGNSTFIKNYLNKNCSGLSVESTSSDLRYDLDLPSNTFDLVLCMEVIEHIKDQDSSLIEDIAAFTGSGIKNLISECARVLKPGGSLLITTPNIHSYRVLNNWLYKGNEIFNYRLHPRELSYKYIEGIVENLFSSYSYVFYNSWETFELPEEIIKNYEEMLTNFGFDTTNRREDDLFFLCRK